MKTIIKILLLIMIPSILSAEGGGSIYSRYGAGDVIHYFSARQLGLGAIGVASNQSDYVNFVNPASLSNLKVVRFEAGLNAYGMNIKGNSNSAFYAGTEFSGFTIGIPLERDLGLAFALGMTPVTSVQYSVVEGHKDDGYAIEYAGSGGISKAFISASYRLPFDWAIGLSFNYFTGNIEYSSTVDYKYNNNYTTSVFKKINNYRGTGFTIGLESGDLSSVFNSEKISNFKLGFVFNYTKNLPTDTTSIIKLSNTPGVEKTALIETDLPIRLDAGLSFVWNENKRVLADYTYSPWENYELGGKRFDHLRASNRVGLGIEFLGSRSMFADSWEKMDFRVGFSYEATHLKIKGENINQVSLHGGFSFPIGMMSTFDFGLQVGQRGTENSGLMKEMFYKANFSLSLGELWFIRIER
ncbi:MAG: hypothetical protein ACEPO8_01120 [Rhodothermaceae bacterium]